MSEQELLETLRVAAAFFWENEPDETVVSIGTWRTPVAGYPAQFNAQLRLTVGDIRSATATPPARAQEE